MNFLKTQEIDKLTTALSKAQSEMVAPKKTKTANAGTYKYQYADLADIMEALIKPMTKHELSISSMIDAETDTLITLLMHSSGQYIGTSYPLPRGLPPQQFGSALTYGRRYSVSALTGLVAEEDDDGKAAHDEVSKQSKAPKKTQAPNPVQPKAVIQPVLPQPPKGVERESLLQSIKSLYIPYMKLYPEVDLAAVMMENYGAKKISDLQDSEAYDFKQFLETQINSGVAV